MSEGIDLSIDPVRQKAADWAKELIQLDGRNALLNFKVSKTGTLDLGHCPDQVLEALLAGQAIRLGEMFTSEESHRDACVRARGLVRKLRGFSEEQGIDVGRLAYGRVVSAPTHRAGTQPVVSLRAPLLLYQVTVQARTAAENDFTLRVEPEPDLNPVLLHCLDRQYGVKLNADEVAAGAESIMNEPIPVQERAARIFALIADSAQQQGVTLLLEPLTAVGICNYQKLPMVDDLMSASILLARHDLIAALAGIGQSAHNLSAQAVYEPPAIDSIRPQDEFLVLDADSSQHHAISAALSGRHVVIDGPPGTGKSQTIANIIAAGSASGLKILFVAEKRAAIEAVTDRLEAVGLDSLVLDLHQSRINKRSVAEQFNNSLDQLSNALPVDGEDVHQQLLDRRQQLIDYKNALHEKRSPWGVSAYEARAILLQLSASQAPQTRIRQLHMFTKDARTQIVEALWAFVANEGFRVLRGSSPWAQAQIRTPEDARQVLAQLDEVRGRSWKQAQSGMHHLLIQAGLPMPQDFSGWEATLRLLSEVSDTVSTLGAGIFDAPLPELYVATAPASRRRDLHPKLPWQHRRKLLKELRTRTGIKQKRYLHEQLGKALGEYQQWQHAAGPAARPGRIEGAAAVGEQYRHLQHQLSAIAMCTNIVHPAQQPIDSVDKTLQALDQDRQLAQRMPDLHSRLQLLSSFGLTELLDELCALNATPDEAVTLFTIALMRALNEEFTLTSPPLRNFGAQAHDRTLAEFVAADEKHKKLAVHRIRRRVAKNVQHASGLYRDELAILRREASKKRRHMPLRQLVGTAPHVMLAIRPCWAMSPLIVSQMLPAQQLFDLVIFDEASQVQPHDAITSIMRGRHLVVAGDDKQLPPTGFFDRNNPDEDTEEADELLLGDYESILSTLQPLIPTRQTLRWHYRSQDERLIRFSNEQIYRNALVTFPGARLDTPVRLEVVDGRVYPGQVGSAATEIARVIELIVDHARTRPQESLGVITLGQQHRDRLDIALRRELEMHPDLNDFFSKDQGPTRRFFIKNIETVQGDERDAIILSLGIGKTAAGAVNRTGFGPLNQEGGERRVNVAVTRAKRRMTVVSSFAPSALEPSDRLTGTELLRRYLESASAGGETSGIGQLTGTKLNGFEQDIYDRLTQRGITVYRQWGVSDYRIDFALAHPEEPAQMVLAVEADGDRYHRAASARDRDRLRQQHLERLGWRFHRVWASAWFSDPQREEQRIVEAWQAAAHDINHAASTPAETTAAPHAAPTAATPVVRAQPRPGLVPGFTIDNYPTADLVALFCWLMSDGRLLDHEERMKQARDELGFKRRGSRIDERLRHAHDQALRQLDQGEH